VIRYDNRDTGQSTCFDFAKSPYTLGDMARDAIGLLDALDVDHAHVVGASMGGMIGQTLAIEHAPRVRTLTSIMSSPAASSMVQAMFGGGVSPLPGPEPKAMRVVGATAANPPRTREERIDAAVRLWRALSGSGEPFDEGAVREREALVQARALNIDAAQNHTLAVGASDRFDALRGLALPVLVIHGSEDPILPLPHGCSTADEIPGAQLLVIEGMGHDIPPRAQKRITQAIIEHTARA